MSAALAVVSDADAACQSYRPVLTAIGTPEDRARVIRLVENMPLSANCPLFVWIGRYSPSRTAAQNRFFHGPVLDAIVDQAWWKGRQYPKAFWKEYLRRRYLEKGEFVTPDGEIVPTFYSTTELSRKRFAEFLDAVFRDAALEWGVQMPASVMQEAMANQYLKRRA